MAAWRPGTDERALKQTLRRWYEEIRGFTTPEAAGPFWGQNVAKYADDYIRADTTFAEDLRRQLGSVAHFSLLVRTAEGGYGPEAYLRWLDKQPAPVRQLLVVEESPMVSDAQCYVHDGRRRSVDLDRRLCHAALLKQHTDFGRRLGGSAGPERPVAFEIGAGHGALARVLKLLCPRATYVIADLPESLYFSAGFLASHFPESRVFLADPRNVGALKGALHDYDFVLLPVGLEDHLAGERIDLVVNTHSLGEMANSQIRKWFRFINRDAVREVFLINRFLNAVGTAVKRDGNEGSLSLDRDWRVRYWEFNPAFMQAPVERHYEPYYLCVAATRDAGARERREGDLRHLYRQPWFERLDTGSHESFPPPGTREGPLFDLWQACRTDDSAEPIFLLLLYLSRLDRPDPIEEYVSLKARLLERLPPAARAWLSGDFGGEMPPAARETIQRLASELGAARDRIAPLQRDLAAATAEVRRLHTELEAARASREEQEVPPRPPARRLFDRMLRRN